MLYILPWFCIILGMSDLLFYASLLVVSIVRLCFILTFLMLGPPSFYSYGFRGFRLSVYTTPLSLFIGSYKLSLFTCVIPLLLILFTLKIHKNTLIKLHNLNEFALRCVLNIILYKSEWLFAHSIQVYTFISPPVNQHWAMCQLALGETRYTEIKIIYLLAMTLCIVTSLHSFLYWIE